MTFDEMVDAMRHEMAVHPDRGIEAYIALNEIRGAMQTGITDVELREQIGTVLNALATACNDEAAQS